MRTGRGKFIVIEGADGAGTTTQSTSLVEKLVAAGQKAHMTQEPSGGPIGKMIREMLSGHEQTELSWRRLALLFAADRLHHYETEIEPLLSEGVHVVSDRYLLSSLIYQSLHAPLAWVAEINRFAPPADAVFVIDIDEGDAWARQQSRGGKKEVYDERELQKEICHRYRTFIPQMNAIRIPGGDGIEEVSGRIVQALKSSVGVRFD